MSATAPRDNHAVEYRPKVGSTGQSLAADTGPSAASSARSLSMMHQAFGGLPAHSERSHSSSTEQQNEAERVVVEASGGDRAPNSFDEEKYSYDSVRESEDSKFALQKFKVGSANVIASTEFFDYLIAIGGV